MRPEPRRGFILPTTMLVLALLTVMLTAAFVMVSAEYRATDNSVSSTRAAALAQAGLQTYFASYRNLKPTDTGDSVRYTYTGGYVDVVAKIYRGLASGASTGVTYWAVRATGVTTDPLLTGQVTAKRSVGQIAQLIPSGMVSPRAALTALNGTTIIGSATKTNPLDGSNMGFGAPSCPGPTYPATVDSNAILTVSGQYSGSTPSGGAITLPTLAALYDSTHLDWPAVLAGNFTPDYIGTTASPNLPAYGNNTWQVGYINGNVTITGLSSAPTSPRQGILVVTGNVTMANNSWWAGLIIAGGTIGGTGNWLIQGAAYSGMNCAVGSCPAQNSINKYDLYNPPYDFREIHWSYCHLYNGIQILTAMAPVKNTFVDNWAGY